MSPTSSYTYTTTEYYPRSYHPALHCRPTIASDHLPNDEYRYLVKLQDRSRLESHFAQPSLPSSSYNTLRKTAYQEQPNLNREWRTKVSETANATRAALGPIFDFTEEGYERMQTANDNRYTGGRHRVESEYEDYVPSRRVHELSQKYWDNDEVHMNEQYRKNGCSLHSGRHIGISPFAHAHPEPMPQLGRKRYDSGIGESPVYGPTPELSSKFDWSSDEDELPKRKRWGRLFRRKLDER